MSLRRSRIPKFIPILSLLILLVLGPIVFSLLQNASGVEAAWVDDNFSYRNAIPITSHTAAENNVYITATIDTSASGQFQADCGDLRFTTVGGDILPYYIVSGCVSASTVVHVFFKSMPAGAQTIYYYYGNPSASNGFSSADFATLASSYALGSPTSQEKGGAPIAYWKFDEGYGTAPKDSTQNANNITTWTGATWINEDQCISGKCLRFNGTSDHMSVTSSTSISPSTAVTLSLWIKPRRCTISSQSAHVFYKSDYYAIYCNDSGSQSQMNGWITDASTRRYVSGTSKLAKQNEWSYVVLTYDGITIKIYVNGVLAGSTDYTGDIDTGSGVLNIGAASSSGYRLDGDLDDVKIYPYARTAAQIKSDFKSRGTAKGSSVSLSSRAGVEGSLSNGLVGYWKMDEVSGAGSTLADSSGNSNTGTAVLWGGGNTSTDSAHVAGKFGNSFSFDGGDDNVTVTDVASLQAGATMTVSTWFKLNATASDKRFVDKTNNGTGYSLAANTTTPRFITGNGSTYDNLDGTTTLATGTWYHMVGTVENGTKRIYVNGNLENTASITFNGVGTGVNFRIGARAASQAVNASIDEIRIYNRALSPREVRDLYAFAPGPVGYWSFEEGSGLSAKDSSGNGNAITLTTAKWTSGKFGKGFDNFDNADYGQIAQIALLNPTTPNLTVESWVYVKEYIDGAINHWQTIVEGSGNLNNANGYYLGFCGSGTSFCWRVGNGTNYDADIAVAQTNIPLNQWVHIASTIDASNSYLYVNGVKIATDPHTITTIAYGAYPISFGTLAYSLGGDHNLHGSIDEVKIYNSALTSDEIQIDYNRGSAMVLGTLSDTSGLTGGSVASSSASAEYCIPGDTTTCTAPVARWDFEEGSGVSANDSSGNSNTGTWAGTGTHSAPGKYGKGGKFNGSDDYVENTSLDNTNFPQNAGTVSLWVKGDFSSQSFKPILDDWAARNHIFIRTNSNGTIQIYFQRASDTAYIFGNSATVNNNSWNFLSVTYDTSTDLGVIYVNGVQTYSATMSDASWAPTQQDMALSKGNYFTGQIDQVRIYNYARSAAQVAWDYNRGGPVGHWRLDECQGATAKDSSGNGNTGTITIGATGTQTAVGTCTTSGTAWYNGVTGKFNSSLNFDGTDDQITGTISNTPATNQVTISYWIKPGSVGTQQNHMFLGTSGSARIVPYMGSDNIFYCWNTVSQLSSGVTISTGTWYNLDCTYDGTNLKVYVNGSLRNTSTISLTLAANNFTIGADNGSWWTNGQIDDVRIYNYALTASQIKSLFNGGAAVKFGPLTGSP